MVAGLDGRRLSAALHEKVRAELNDTVVDIAKQVEQILTAVFNINKRLKGRVDMTMALGLSDIKAQMGGLVYRGFVTGNGFKRLGDTLRYLQAIEKRLEKLAVDPHRDRAQMLKVENVQQAWQQWINKLRRPHVVQDEDVKEIRWMIEELRVSYFAQQMVHLIRFQISVFWQDGARLAVNTAICLINLKPGKHLAPGFLLILKR
ncbi:DUF3418 domain-containing protein [Escherichia coli]